MTGNIRRFIHAEGNNKSFRIPKHIPIEMHNLSSYDFSFNC